MKPVKFATQIDENVLKKLKSFAKLNDRSISKVVSDAIREYLQRAEVRPAFKTAMDEVLNDNAELLSRLAK